MRPTETSRLRSWPEKKADFVEPMECEIVSKLREGSEWVYEVKLDGYRAIAVRSGRIIGVMPVAFAILSLTCSVTRIAIRLAFH